MTYLLHMPSFLLMPLLCGFALFVYAAFWAGFFPYAPSSRGFLRLRNILVALFAILLLGISVYVHLRVGFFGDKDWELAYARMWLRGKELYQGIFPVSPPLIFLIYALPVMLSQCLEFLRDYEALVLLGLCVIALSIALSTRLIALHPEFANATAKQAGFVLLLCFILVFRTTPIYFMDREHLFLLLVLPYIMRVMPSLCHAPIPRWMSVAIGCMAGIGFCMKPHCYIVLAGVQLLYILRERSFRILISPESIIIYTIGLLYVLAVWWLTPEYFSLVLPMAWATYASNRDEGSRWLYGANALSALAFALLMFRLRYTSPYRKDIMYFLGLCVAFFAYALANNNWPYTYNPLTSMTLVTTAFILWEFLYLRKQHISRNLPSWNFVLGYSACILTFVIRTLISFQYFLTVFLDTHYLDPRRHSDNLFVAEVQQETGHPLSFGAISIDFTRWTRLVRYTGAAWETRFSHLWMLPEFLLHDASFTRKHQWILDYVGNAFAEDLNRNKPAVVFVDDSDVFYIARVHVDLVPYFSAVPSFREAWKQYRYAHSIDICRKPRIAYGPPVAKEWCRYDVYRRIP